MENDQGFDRTKMKNGAFRGVKIVSFSWAMVGPLTMKYFADHEATVIRME